MYASDNAVGRSFYTADTAELTTFDDCARWTIRWNDGAWVYCVEDTKEEAAAALRRYGF